MPYGDFNVTCDLQGNPVVSEQMRHLEGFGLPAQQTVGTSATRYLHGDLIRSTMLTSGQGGTAVSAVSYTAFGEVIGTAPETRYQYAGGWGYETGGFADDPGLLVLNGAEGTAPITLMHVGFRWYDPAIGRFIQRDPLGVLGDLNVYEYARSNPLGRIDPLGLDRWDVVEDYRAIQIGVKLVYNPRTGYFEYFDVYQTQLLIVTYEDHTDSANLLNLGSILTAAEGAIISLLGGPAGAVAYLACVSLGLTAASAGTSALPPTRVGSRWEDLGPPFDVRDSTKDIPKRER